MQYFKRFAILSALMISSFTAWADYPTKPITLVSPYGLGGAADLAARILAATAPNYLGQEVLVVNRTGEAGVTGSTSVIQSQPDGYTLLLARVGSQATVPATNHSIPYRWNEYTFLGLLELNPFVFVVKADSPYRTLDDIKQALEQGDKLSYASVGTGTLLQVAIAMLLDQWNMPLNKMQHTPYKGGGKAAAAVANGEVDMMFQNLSGVISNIQAGKLRALAITTPQRIDALAQVPTVAEAGYPKLEAIVGWSGLWGPADLPDTVTQQWIQTLQKLKQDKDWNKMTKKLGSIPAISSPEATRIFVHNQYEVFKDLAKKIGMTIIQ